MFVLQQGMNNERTGDLMWLDAEAFNIMREAVEAGEGKGNGVWRVVEIVPVWENDAAIEITGGEA